MHVEHPGLHLKNSGKEATEGFKCDLMRFVVVKITDQLSVPPPPPQKKTSGVSRQRCGPRIGHSGSGWPCSVC